MRWEFIILTSRSLFLGESDLRGLGTSSFESAGYSLYLISIELGDTKEIGSLVATSIYSAVDAEIGLLLVTSV